MSERLPQAVYWRRRAVALAVVITPLLLVLRACAGTDATTPTPSPTTTKSPAVETTTAAKQQKPKPETTTVAKKPKKTPTPAQTVGDCRGSELEVTITADALSYPVGSPVTLAVRIANLGTTACKRDVGALANEVYITDIEGTVVWSSDACQVDNRTQVVTMKPGSVFGNTQVWAGLNSGRDCASAAPDAAPGTYFAYGRNDSVVSKGFAFTLT